MSKLRELEIKACGLVMLPQDLQMVTTLQELKVVHIHSDFCQRFRTNDGEDWQKIRHVPSVILYHDS